MQIGKIPCANQGRMVLSQGEKHKNKSNDKIGYRDDLTRFVVLGYCPDVSIVVPCYNEEDNVEAAYLEIRQIFARLPEYDYEHIFIDNASEDQTVSILKKLAKQDPRLKIIVNTTSWKRYLTNIKNHIYFYFLILWLHIP